MRDPRCDALRLTFFTLAILFFHQAHVEMTAAAPARISAPGSQDGELQ